MYKVIILDSNTNIVEMSKTNSKEVALTQAVALKVNGFTAAVQFPDGTINNRGIIKTNGGVKAPINLTLKLYNYEQINHITTIKKHRSGRS